MATAWRDPDLRLVLHRRTAVPPRTRCELRPTRAHPSGSAGSSDADRNGLLGMAEAMVFPSEYEGFGAPLIEAMALGAPLLRRDSTCIPTIVGGAGLVLPLSTDAWADALDVWSRDRASMVAAGLQRAAAFTARASGVALAAVYAAALEGS